MVLKNKQKQQKVFYLVFHIQQLWNFEHYVQGIYSFHSSVQFSRSIGPNTLRPHGLQHARLSCPSPTPRAHSNSCPWRRYAIQPSHSLLSPSPLASILPSIRVISNKSVFCIRWPNFGVSAQASVCPKNIQDRFSLGLTGFISLKSKGCSRIFFNTTVQNHHFFSIQPSLWSNSHIHT